MIRKLTRRRLLAGSAAMAASAAAIGALPRLPAARAEAAARTNHALLVAVTIYPELPERTWLIGPNNDARLARHFLLGQEGVPFAEENVRVLADGIDEFEVAGSPTLANIRSELDALADRVRAGDFVYLQFGGHGTQQVAIDPSTEPDGMDEVFLPADTGRYDRELKANPNVLRDFEIGERLQKIRDAGAFVWVVFDCCHSGTMTRAIELEDEVERRLEPSDLGIPPEDIAAAVAAAAGGAASRSLAADADERQNMLGIEGSFSDPETTRSAAEEGAVVPGGMVAFFAAQTVETTPELPLPRGAEDARRLGLFTFTLFSRIADNPSATYRQLADGIIQSYAGQNRTKPTPLFEGDLDARVFGTTPEPRIAQWPIRVRGAGIEIPAGSVHRLSAGAKLAIVPEPTSGDDEALGYVEVVRAQSLSSAVRPIDHNGIPALAPAAIPAGGFARLVELAVDLEMTVALAPADTHGERARAVNDLVAAIAADQSLPMNLNIVEPGRSADLALAVMSERDVLSRTADEVKDGAAAFSSEGAASPAPRLWLLPPSLRLSLQPGRRAPSIDLAAGGGRQPADAGGGSLPAGLGETLADNLLMIYRAVSLSRIALASDYRPDEFDVRFRIVRMPSGEAEYIDPTQVPIVHPDDEVHLEASNDYNRPVDINVLYVGSDYSITHMVAERLHPRSKLDLGLFYFTPDSFGIERMVVVLSEGEAITATQDLSFLAQPGVRQLSRSVGDGPPSFMDLVTDLGMAPPTRAAAPLAGRGNAGSRGSVLVFPMENAPRA